MSNCFVYNLNFTWGNIQIGNNVFGLIELKLVVRISFLQHSYWCFRISYYKPCISGTFQSYEIQIWCTVQFVKGTFLCSI